MMRPERFCLRLRIPRRPKSSRFIFSVKSSPTSNESSTLRASSSEISVAGFSTSSTTVRVRIMTKSPLSTLVITSNIASSPYILASWALNTSSMTLIIVSRSMFFCSLNSVNELFRFVTSILCYCFCIDYSSSSSCGVLRTPVLLTVREKSSLSRSSRDSM